MDLGLLIIHGMGAQSSDFADPLRASLTLALRADAARLAWQPVYWADVLGDRESSLWTTMSRATSPSGERIRLDWREARSFIVHNFGDALAYHRDVARSAYDEVHTRISASIAALARMLPANAPVVVLAHSLGAHMMSNYIWDRQHAASTPDPLAPLPTLAGFITFGCNIPLFSLSFPVARPFDFPGTGVTLPSLRSASRWLNFLDSDDVLGWPVRPLYEQNAPDLTPEQRETVQRIEDHEIAVGGLGSSWNPASHGAYWDDDDFVAPVAAYLHRLLRTID